MMYLFLTMITLFLFLFNIEARWKLEWNDEFEENNIDKQNWEIDEQDDKTCDFQNIGRLNCFTNSSKNIRLIDGTLSLAAIYEKRLNKKFSSALIMTTKQFTFGRIDIRAALPMAKLLSPWVKLVSPDAKNREGFIMNKQLIVFTGDQTNWIRYVVPFLREGAKVDHYLTDGTLNEFHIYSIEWNKTGVIWKFDGIQTNWMNLTNFNTFLNNPVILKIYLRVGGFPFKNQGLTLEDVYDWDCSLFTLDYVRYYQWTDEEVVHTKQIESIERKLSEGFCKSVMDEISPKKEARACSGISMTIFISVICFLLLLNLIPLIVWLVIRMITMSDPAPKGHHLNDNINNIELREIRGQDNIYV